MLAGGPLGPGRYNPPGMPIRVLHVGLGPIGLGVVRQVAGRKGLTAVGAVDLDPGKVGRDLGDIAELGRKLRLKVQDDVDAAIRATKPDVAILCTSSSIAKLVPQVAAIVKRRVPIVSTTEELAYPDHRRAGGSPGRSTRWRKRRKVAVLGTGVNPGFVMDALPIMLTGVCESVEKVHVDRVQDARIRRLPFQQKIGSGLTPEAFQARVDAGTVRHVGLTESITMIADALGWTLDRITDDIAPKIAEMPVIEPVPDRRRRPGLRPDPGRRRLSQGRAGDHAAHGGLPRGARVVRRRADRGYAAAPHEDRRRRPRRHRHGLDRGQLDPKVLAAAARSPHDADLPLPSFFGGKLA